MLRILGGLALASALAAQTGGLDEGYRDLYNLEFEPAHHVFQEWERAHPADPLGPVSDAAAWLFAEMDRLHILEAEFFATDRRFLDRTMPPPDPAVKRRFEEALERGRGAAQAALRRNPNDDDAIFATILRLGLHADYLALIEKRYLPSLSEMKAARELAAALLARRPDYADAALAIGVENYLLSLRPAPLRWMLRLGGAQTDQAEGVARLRVTAAGGRYLRPYAQLLLAVAAIRGHAPARARELLSGLTREFPRNPLYPQELARLQ